MSQSKATTGHEFRKTTDLVAAGVTLTKTIKVDPTPLVGTWLAANKATGGIVKLVITNKAGDIFIESFGACHPSPCPWGNVQGVAFAENVSAKTASSFTAPYNFGFSTVEMTGELFEGALILNTFTVFHDGSGRSSYHGNQILYRP